MKQKHFIFGILSLGLFLILSACVNNGSDESTIAQTEPETTTEIQPEADNRCSLAPEAGTCKARFIKYYFDAQESICKEFVWGGCDGVVPFETLESCKEICEV